MVTIVVKWEYNVRNVVIFSQNIIRVKNIINLVLEQKMYYVLNVVPFVSVTKSIYCRKGIKAFCSVPNVEVRIWNIE